MTFITKFVILKADDFKEEKMNIATVFLMGVALSMDAFAVSVTKGITTRKINISKSLVIAAFFGAFQGIMPILGYFLGCMFCDYIMAFDHLIAFVLLAFIGGKMIYEAFSEKESEKEETGFSLRELFVLAIATSIDALAVGVSLSFMNVNIFSSAGIIALTTFCISFAGVLIGKKFGNIFKNKAEIIGGVILICIGLKILIEHLFFS